jgi:hypothetical protein
MTKRNLRRLKPFATIAGDKDRGQGVPLTPPSPQGEREKGRRGDGEIVRFRNAECSCRRGGNAILYREEPKSIAFLPEKTPLLSGIGDLD